MAQWSQAIAAPGKPQHLMLLIAEVKEIVPARYGFKAVVKHVPDQAFALDEQLYRRLGRRFESELALWGAADDIHMVMIATFSVAAAGIPTIVELSLMPVTRHWLPVEDGFEKQLVERLVADGRSFVKGLRYNLGAESALASATLTDCGQVASSVVGRAAVTAAGTLKLGSCRFLRGSGTQSTRRCRRCRPGAEVAERLRSTLLKPDATPSPSFSTGSRHHG